MPEPYSEAQTRQQIIDQRLQLAGWNVDDPSQVIQELDIYVQDGKPTAVRERSARYAGHQVAAANAYVDTHYLPAHHRRFATEPASTLDYHRPRAACRRADADVFCLETTRVVGNDHVVEYQGRSLQLGRQIRGRVPAKSRVLVREAEDGTIRLVHLGRDGRERVVRWIETVARAAKPTLVTGSGRPTELAAAATPRRPLAAPTAPGTQRSVPAAPDHPWRRQHGQWAQRARARKAQRVSSHPAA